MRARIHLDYISRLVLYKSVSYLSFGALVVSTFELPRGRVSSVVIGGYAQCGDGFHPSVG